MKFAIALIIIVITLVILVGSYAKTLPLSLKDQNIDIVRLSIHAFNEGDWSSFADLHSPNYLHHAPDSIDPVSLCEYMLSCSVAHEHFADLQYRIVDIFADNDNVAVLCTWHYRNDSYQFKKNFPDGAIQGSEINIYRIKDVKIIEDWYGCGPLMMQRLVSFSKSIEHIK
ncbi:hypothetical protein ES703_26454 [subsurface metagenome]